MRTFIRFEGPPGCVLPEPYYSAIDVLHQYKIKEGEVIRFKPVFFPEGRWCRIERIKENKMCREGFRANIITVRPLSTLN